MHLQPSKDLSSPYVLLETLVGPLIDFLSPLVDIGDSYTLGCIFSFFFFFSIESFLFEMIGRKRL